ncbi:hypothetical protein L2D01_03750 [Hyphomonadaceae bacterium ML37]|nr:hypothetical protein L2D01_03750 [Hyphomonadaceae bacterium ML37]
MSVFIKTLAIIIMLTGLALSWTPIPFGIVLIALGAAMIVTASQSTRHWLHRRRVKNPKLDRWLCAIEDKAPDCIARPLRETDAGSRDR